MLSTAVRIKTLTLVGLLMAVGGCIGDVGDRPDGWKFRADVRDAASDSEEADVVDAEDVRTGDVQDAIDTRDTSDVAPLDCTCAVEGATCERVDQRAVCVHEEANCSERACPEGFFCRDGRCDCDFDVHGPECRPECNDHDDCGKKQYCNVNDRCFQRRKCFYKHALCPPGYWCDFELSGRGGTCRRSGEKPVGATCEKDWNCASGSCFEEICIRTCLAEEDCPGSNRACDRFDKNRQLLGCYETSDSEPDCKISCPEDQVCNRDECLPHACHRTAQCPEGDCVLSPEGFRDRSLGQCAGEERMCNGWEFRLEEDDPFCRLGIDCERRPNPEDFSCPEGYECVEGVSNSRGTSWCSRRVTDGKWPPG